MSPAKELLKMGHDTTTELYGQSFTVDGVDGEFFGNLSIDDLTVALSTEGMAPAGTARLDVDSEDLRGWVPTVGKKIYSDGRDWRINAIVPDSGFYEIQLITTH